MAKTSNFWEDLCNKCIKEPVEKNLTFCKSAYLLVDCCEHKVISEIMNFKSNQIKSMTLQESNQIKSMTLQESL